MNLKPIPLLLLGAAVLSGCNHISTTAERDASFAPYAKTMIHDANLGAQIDLRAYTAFRTALVLVAGTEPSTFTGVGSAAAIDRRGYYLTAAHAVAADTVALQVWCKFPRDWSAEKPSMTSEAASVVWRGNVDKGEPDLAILYTSRPPEWVFEWSPDPKSNLPAVSTGLNYASLLSLKEVSSGASGGKLLSSEAHKSAALKWEVLTGTLPLHGGDSGGPLTNTSGQLLGINYEVWSLTILHLFPPRKERAWKSNSVRPDLDWLRLVIDEDYAKRPNAPAIAAFWKRPDAAKFLAQKLLEDLHRLETARLASGAPEDKRAAYNRQELVRKILADAADLNDPSFIPVLNALPRNVPTSPVLPADVDRLAAVLRTEFLMN